MKYLTTMLAASAVLSAPVWAATQTIEFAGDNGETETWVLSDDGTATSGDVTVNYTWDEEALKLCAEMPEQGELCVTFEEAGSEVGDTSKYTTSDGESGVAKIIEIVE